LPFHRSIKVVPVLEEPTAQALVADVAATPASAAPPAGLGLGTCFHAVPFQRRIKVLPPAVPTAQALLADVAATPAREPPDPGDGLGTCVQEVPFHRRIKVLAPLVPTAQALVADVAATPNS
jgi:hypothetical protein